MVTRTVQSLAAVLVVPVNGTLYSPVHRGPKWPFGKSGRQSEVLNPALLVPGLFLVGLESVGLASGLILATHRHTTESVLLVPYKNMQKTSDILHFDL